MRLKGPRILKAIFALVTKSGSYLTTLPQCPIRSSAIGPLITFMLPPLFNIYLEISMICAYEPANHCKEGMNVFLCISFFGFRYFNSYFHFNRIARTTRSSLFCLLDKRPSHHVSSYPCLPRKCRTERGRRSHVLSLSCRIQCTFLCYHLNSLCSRTLP